MVTYGIRSNETIAKTDLSKYKVYGIPEERMVKLMGVKPAYLEAAFAGINKKYGSIDKMLLVELGIDKKVKKQIQKKIFSKINLFSKKTKPLKYNNLAVFYYVIYSTSDTLQRCINFRILLLIILRTDFFLIS